MQRLLAPVGLALLLAAGRNAGAQQPAPRDSVRRDSTVRRLPPVEVRTSIAPVAGPAVGSGVPAQVSTLSARAIDALEPRTMADALATQPGVSIYDDLGTPYKQTISSRGFTAGPTVGLPAGVTVFLDGVRQNEPDAQEVNFDLLPMEHVARVELLSGSASLLGPNSLAGAVNLVTRRGSGPPSGEIELAGGSFGLASAEGAAGGRTAGGWDWWGSGGWQRERGWRDGTGADGWNALVNVGRSGERRGFGVQAFGGRSRTQSAGSLPESIFRRAPRTNFTPGDVDDLDAEQLALAAHAPVGGGDGALTLYARRSAAERFNVNQPPDANVRSLTDNLTVGTTADWRWSRGRALALRAGVDAAANAVRVRILAEPQAGGDSLTTDVRSPSSDVAGYAMADLKLGRATLSGGARWDDIRVPFRNAIVRGDRTTSRFRRLNPRAGLSVEPAPGQVLYASVGQSFRAPAILELGCADPEASCPLPFALGEDPPLQPVRATTWETGGRWAVGRVLLSGALYRAEVRDEIFFVASARALLSGYFTNIPRTRREGAELGARWFLGERASGYASATWTRATFRSATQIFTVRADSAFAGSPLAGPNDVKPGAELPLVPRTQLKAGADVQLTRHWSAGLDARRTGRQWLRGDEANETRPLDAWSAVDARVAWRRGDWELSAIASNLLDAHPAIFGTFNENRRTGALERFLTPLTARTLKLVVRRGFGSEEE